MGLPVSGRYAWRYDEASQSFRTWSCDENPHPDAGPHFNRYLATLRHAQRAPGTWYLSGAPGNDGPSLRDRLLHASKPIFGLAHIAAPRYLGCAPTPGRVYVNEVDDRPEFRFGRTVVSVAVGDLLGQEAEAIVVAANRRGVLGPLATPGLTGLRSLGGSEIEREAMRLAPLDLGTAVVTGAWGLEERGIRAVVHAVVHPALGERARIEHVRRVVPAALMAASKSRLRTVAMPLLGVESLAAKTDVDVMVAAVVDELVGSLRRSIPRLDRLTIVCRFTEHAESVEAALARARERVWTRVP